MKLFKKHKLYGGGVNQNPDVIIIEDEKPPKTISSKEMIDIIHNDFKSQDLELVKEIEQLEFDIKDNKQKIEKANRLYDLGFSSCNEYEQNKKLISKQDEIQNKKRELQYFESYKIKYPLNKFITDKQVKNLCLKYKLVMGPLNRYIGFVPEKNLIEMENFDKIFDKKDTDKDRYGSYIPRQICASANQMDTSGMKITDDYKLVKDDPIVLRPVKGGYLIETAWGDEASDPSVLNTINN